MKPYGVDHIGPICAWGCCYMQNPRTSPGGRKCGHGGTPSHLRAQRRKARREGVAEARAALDEARGGR